MIHNNLERGGTGFKYTTFIPNHGIRCSASVTIMNNLDTRHSNHELMEIKHYRIPVPHLPEWAAVSAPCCQYGPRSEHHLHEHQLDQHVPMMDAYFLRKHASITTRRTINKLRPFPFPPPSYTSNSAQPNLAHTNEVHTAS